MGGQRCPHDLARSQGAPGHPSKYTFGQSKRGVPLVSARTCAVLDTLSREYAADVLPLTHGQKEDCAEVMSLCQGLSQKLPA